MRRRRELRRHARDDDAGKLIEHEAGPEFFNKD